MRLALALGFGAKGASNLAPPTGPIRLTAPTVSPGAPATEGVTQTLTPGTYSARGGGSVAVTRAWQTNGVTRSTALTYAPPAGTYTGQTLTVVETATETGGTAAGSTTYPITIGVIEAVVATNQITDMAGDQILDMAGNQILDMAA